MIDDVVLKVESLKAGFEMDQGLAVAVDDVSFQVKKGKTLGIVGESGCGKTVTAMSIMQLLPQPFGKLLGGEINYRGQDLLKSSKHELRKLRGNKIAMIFQDPMTALNPVYRIGRQLGDIFRLHRPGMTAEDIRAASIGCLLQVGIPAPDQRIDEYPHQLSGGMRQRVMIAMALACEPDLLIADEPTTALDVTIQAQILELIIELQKRNHMAVMLITHDLGVVAETCDEVVVMYGGRVAEKAQVNELFSNPKHPYTAGLLRSMPHLGGGRKKMLPTIEGMVPGLFDWPKGCRFQQRCPWVSEVCRTTTPEGETLQDNHQVFCHNWRQHHEESPT